MSNKKSNFGLYLFIFFVIIFSILHIRGSLIQNDIKNHGHTIVAQFIKKKNYPKTTDFYFGYFHNGKYYETSGSGIKHSITNSDAETKLIDNLKRKHFYSAKLNPKYPESIIVNPANEITDTILIKQAGFSLK